MMKVRGQFANRNQILVVCGLISCLLLFVLLFEPKTKYILDTTAMKLKSSSAFFLESDYAHLVNINFTFIIRPLVCNGNEKNILVLVHSAIGHFKNRKVIRETWGQHDNIVKFLFLVGTTKDAYIQKRLEEESKQHNDMLQGSFLDTYHNLTYKHVMALKYAVYHCPQAEFVLKVDDDVFVNIPTLKMFLAAYMCQNGESMKILCTRIYNPDVFRSGKWEVSLEEYPENHYPTHCGGFAILYPRKVISTLYKVAQANKFFWIDDVFVSGICAKQANISHIGIENLVLSNRDTRNIVDLSLTNINKPFLFGWIELNENQIRSLWKFAKNHPPKTILDYLT